MLQLLETWGRLALVGYDTPEKDFPELNDWSVEDSTFTTHRTAWIGVPNAWSTKILQRFLEQRRTACIYTIVSHNPIMVKGESMDNIPSLVRQQRIVIEGKPYIDMFGLYVYITPRAAWDLRSDVDLRFKSNRYPYHRLTPEYELILNADYDILNRNPGRSSDEG